MVISGCNVLQKAGNNGEAFEGVVDNMHNH